MTCLQNRPLLEQNLRALVVAVAQRTTRGILGGMSVDVVTKELPSLFRPLQSLLDQVVQKVIFTGPQPIERTGRHARSAH